MDSSNDVNATNQEAQLVVGSPELRSYLLYALCCRFFHDRDITDLEAQP